MNRMIIIRLDSENRIKLRLCVVFNHNSMSIATELQVCTIFSNDRSNPDALVSERLGL